MLFLSPSQTSYDAAIDILQTRFGSTTVVTEAFRKRLDNWPKLKETDSKSLQRFSDFLAQACVAKKSFPSLKILDDEFENKKIAKEIAAKTCRNMD